MFSEILSKPKCLFMLVAMFYQMFIHGGCHVLSNVYSRLLPCSINCLFMLVAMFYQLFIHGGCHVLSIVYSWGLLCSIKCLFLLVAMFYQMQAHVREWGVEVNTATCLVILCCCQVTAAFGRHSFAG